MKFISFPRGIISPIVNIVVRPDFHLAYYDVIVKHVNYYAP